MAGLEIENLAVSALPEAAGTEDFAAGIGADKQEFIRRGDDERLAVGFLMFQREGAVDAAGWDVTAR